MRPINILLVEDQKMDVDIITSVLQQEDVPQNHHIVCDGQEALDFVFHRGAYQELNQYPRPDLILLDLNLPRMNGFEVLKAIKEDPDYEDIHVIVVTCSDREQDFDDSYAVGAVSFIRKTPQYEELTSAFKLFKSYWFEKHKA